MLFNAFLHCVAKQTESCHFSVELTITRAKDKRQRPSLAIGEQAEYAPTSSESEYVATLSSDGSQSESENEIEYVTPTPLDGDQEDRKSNSSNDASDNDYVGVHSDGVDDYWDPKSIVEAGVEHADLPTTSAGEKAASDEYIHVDETSANVAESASSIRDDARDYDSFDVAQSKQAAVRVLIHCVDDCIVCFVILAIPFERPRCKTLLLTTT